MPNKPRIHPSVYLAPGAVVVGDVQIGEQSSVWFNAVIRADEEPIRIGKSSNIQDNCTLHVGRGYGVVMGDGVSVGHNAIVHGSTVGGNCIVGMGAILLSGSVIGRDCIIGAGAVVKENEHIPDRSLVVGVPAKVVRKLTDEDIARIRENAEEYLELRKTYLAKKP